MPQPDFAASDLSRLGQGDLRFLLENMPRAGASHAEITQTLEQFPNTLESMLSSHYVFELIRDRRRMLLDISPFLLFNVLLRHSLGRPRTPLERRVLNYLANLLTLFLRNERLQRIAPDDQQEHAYLWELVAEAERGNEHRRFLAWAHLGNYALWLSGLQHAWLEQRHRYGRRPLSPAYYAEQGQSGFGHAARHRLAREFGLEDIFLRLAMGFEVYQQGLHHMREQMMAV